MQLAAIVIAFWVGSALSSFTPQGGQNPCRLDRVRSVIKYSILSGQTGTKSEWYIFGDGTVCIAGKFRAKLSAESATKLLDDNSAAGFYNLKRTYVDRNAAQWCHQCNYYEISVQNAGKAKTVRTHDGAKSVPIALWEILSKIQHHLSGLRKS